MEQNAEWLEQMKKRREREQEQFESFQKHCKKLHWYAALQEDTQYWLGEIKKLMVEQGVNITLDELERLRFNENEVREALSGLTHVTCEDWYDTGYALGRARGWNDCLDEIKKLLEGQNDGTKGD